MKKRIAIMIALLLVITALLPVISACKTEKSVTNLKFVDPQTSYYVDDTIEYDNLKVEITYEDQSQETKTVKALTADGATLKKADLSQVGSTYYSIAYKGLTARVDITVTAKSVDVKDEVAVVLNYHDGKTNPVTIMVERNTALGDKLPSNPEREGYTFDGWYTAETGGTKWAATALVQAPMQLHARWTEVKVEKVTVKFYYNGDVADQVYRTLEINKGDVLSSFPANPTREGYTFDGWYTEAEGGNKWNLETVINEDLSLYAHWTEGSGEEDTQVTVTLHYQDNLTSDGIVVIDKGTALGDKLPSNPTRSGYTFEGWYTEATAGDKWSAEDLVENDLDLYAQWKEVVIEYVKVTLVFHDNSTDNREVTIIKGTALGSNLSTLERPNYQFDGWFTQETGGTEWTADMLVNEDIELHAHWTLLSKPDKIQTFEPTKAYSDYKLASGRTSTETQADFRITGLPYEVGNVNKFIFVPVVTALDGDTFQEKTIAAPTTSAKVYTKTSAEAQYTELTGEDLANFVVITNNQYKFNEEIADGTYVRLEISLNETLYDVSSITNKITVDFIIVDGGYNVYNQRGLSVMADLEKMAWSEIWKCETRIEGNKVLCIPNADSLQLPADSKPLCEYVGNVKCVILHNKITLDPDDMPSLYFWTSEPGLVTSDSYTAAWDSIKNIAPFNNGKDTLVGTLRGGDDSAETTDRNYMRVIDALPSEEATEGNYKVNGQLSIETGIYLNMQKGLFATKKVSVSGNYQSLFTPAKGERSALGRLLEVYVDWNHPTGPEAPDTVYSVFHMLQSKLEGEDIQEFAIKNIAMQGNNPKENTEGFVSAGLMIIDSYNMNQSYYNVNATQFCRMMNADDYGVIEATEEGKVGSGTPLDATVNFNGAKLYNAYSNMFSLWRSSVTIENTEMIGSGGPLFIMNDGTRLLSDNSANTDDTGCEVEADDISVLQAYATGNESWYAIWKAQPLFSNIGASIEPVMNALGKTLQTSKNDNKYYNVIAAMICSPGDLFNGAGAADVSKLVDVRGVYKQYGETYAMHNDFLVSFRQYILSVGGNASMFAPIIQSGNNIFALTGSMQVGDNTIPRIQRLDGTSSTTSSDSTEVLQVFGAEQAAWASNDSKLICIYMSAGAMEGGAPWAPYFGIVIELNKKSN